MKLKAAAVAGAATALVAVSGAGAAQAQGLPYNGSHSTPQTIVADDAQAWVYGTYKCSGGAGTLWASIKQGGKGDLTAEGSSSTARSWYDAHIALKCDGTFHVLKARVAKEPPNSGHPTRYKNLYTGKAYVQWCVTVGNSLISSDSRWHQVRQVS
jgi:hypothetical protein